MEKTTKELLKDWLDGMERKELYVQVTSVAKSGMSRKMKVRLVKNNKILTVTYHVAEIIDYKLNDDDTITIKGCGMDMCQWLVMRISKELYNDDYAIHTYYL